METGMREFAECEELRWLVCRGYLSTSCESPGNSTKARYGQADRRSPKSQAEFFHRAAEKVRTQFPKTPGVYLFQDQAGRVLYIGKARILRPQWEAIFSRRRPRTSGLVAWFEKSTMSTIWLPKAKLMRC